MLYKKLSETCKKNMDCATLLEDVEDPTKCEKLLKLKIMNYLRVIPYLFIATKQIGLITLGCIALYQHETSNIFIIIGIILLNIAEVCKFILWTITVCFPIAWIVTIRGVVILSGYMLFISILPNRETLELMKYTYIFYQIHILIYFIPIALIMTLFAVTIPITISTAFCAALILEVQDD